MNSIQIEYFLEVARQGNFTKAAQLLYTAQPALSRQIANLEEELDVTLFERGKSGTQLTSIGQKYYELFLRKKQFVVHGSANAECRQMTQQAASTSFACRETCA